MQGNPGGSALTFPTWCTTYDWIGTKLYRNW